MSAILTGIHHVTALAKDPRENHDFYTRVLGQRLIKKTVNFDDPLTYHLYFGDRHGSPGTLLTHFPHPNAKRGVHGSPEILETALSVPAGSLDYWAARLRAHDVAVADGAGGADDGAGGDGGGGADGDGDAGGAGGDERRLSFEDPDGMRLALVEGADSPAAPGYAGHDVEPRHAVGGIDAVVIRVPDPDGTTRFLRDALGFRSGSGDGARRRLHLGEDRPGARLDVVRADADPATRMGAGTVHHVAWRVPDDATHKEAAARVRAAGVPVTPVIDRQYFRSIYFRVPGGVIFEIATDGPGFTVDEAEATLGRDLKLPERHEPRRAEIESHLIPLRTGLRADTRAERIPRE